MSIQIPAFPEPLQGWRKFLVDDQTHALYGLRGARWYSPRKQARCGVSGPPCPGKGGRRLTTCYIHHQRQGENCAECRDWRDEHWSHGIFAYTNAQDPDTKFDEGEILALVQLWGWVWPHNDGQIYRAQWGEIVMLCAPELPVGVEQWAKDHDIQHTSWTPDARARFNS